MPPIFSLIFIAASGRSSAKVISNLDSSKINLASLELVPLKTATIGILFVRFLLPATIPAAATSHLSIPPKRFTKINLTSSSDVIILYASQEFRICLKVLEILIIHFVLCLLIEHPLV